MLITKKEKRLEKWLEKKGFILKYGKCDQVDFTLKEVTLYSKQKDLLFSALHECGHIKLYNKKSYQEDFSVVKKSYQDGRILRTNIYKYQKIKEEILAWEEGFKLSLKLGIKICKEDYFIYAAKYVNGYRKNL